MGIRSQLQSILSAPAGRLVESRVREMIEEVLATRGFVRPSELEGLKARLAALEGASAEAGQAAHGEAVARLDTEVANLRKRLNMALGAIQATTAQVTSLRQLVESQPAAPEGPTVDTEARHDAQQAAQRATSAMSTAESVADGVASLENRLSEVDEQLGRLEEGFSNLEETLRSELAAARSTPAAPDAPAAPAKASTPDAAASKPDPDDDDPGCKVPGCESKHRARGFCAKHYQQWRRGTLPYFVGPEGQLLIGDDAWEVDADYAGEPAFEKGGTIYVGDTAIRAKRV